jgi:hypothetical protein
MSQDERLVSVRRVQDETTATLLVDFLRSNGVPATAVAMQIPWLPGVETFRQGFWGHVEVMERDAEKALALIEDFYAGDVQDEPGLEGPTNGADLEEDDEESENRGDRE